MILAKDTGNFRIIKKTQYLRGNECVPRFEPQKEIKFLWITTWEPITYPSYVFDGGTIDSPYLVESLKDAKDIIESYKNNSLDGFKNEVVYEERN